MMRRLTLILCLLLLASSALATGYTELFQAFKTSGGGAWEEIDLSGPVPANAICEVVCWNGEEAKACTVGVRNTSSSLNRYLSIHEAEGGGANTFRMTVNADANSKIDAYMSGSASPDSGGFYVVGYWDTGTYVELVPSSPVHLPNVSDAWSDETLSAIAASSVAEIVCLNRYADGPEYIGVRENGSSLDRRFELHECEPTNLDNTCLTLFAKSNADKVVELYGPSTVSNVGYHAIGYWSDPPGTWTELMYEVPDASADDTWEDEDLTGQATDGAVLEWVMANDRANSVYTDGVHTNGSSLERKIAIDEAEQSGQNLWSCHVKSDAGGVVEMYQDDYSYSTHYLTGQWVIGGAPTYRRRVIITE